MPTGTVIRKMREAEYPLLEDFLYEAIFIPEDFDGEIGYILNPKIVEVSKDEYQDGDEGCLSVPGLWFPTERAWYARAEGVNLDGKEVVVEGEELMARCIQHECDHLEGHLYLDRLDRKNRAKAMKELRAQGL